MASTKNTVNNTIASDCFVYIFNPFYAPFDEIENKKYYFICIEINRKLIFCLKINSILFINAAKCPFRLQFGSSCYFCLGERSSFRRIYNFLDDMLVGMIKLSTPWILAVNCIKKLNVIIEALICSSIVSRQIFR